ncbi:hypothetical protein NPIL_59621 [Nephila pilipes]|uniref:Uncharacterized protein n=1 Tax=Nephila pilipes TaxID=299642 RepID=A0A8X6P0Q9_NEPPI|nr:hypothetical protein NPIL_59621 [Nephila pilipes]
MVTTLASFSVTSTQNTPFGIEARQTDLSMPSTTSSRFPLPILTPTFFYFGCVNITLNKTLLRNTPNALLSAGTTILSYSKLFSITSSPFYFIRSQPQTDLFSESQTSPNNPSVQNIKELENSTFSFTDNNQNAIKHLAKPKPSPPPSSAPRHQKSYQTKNGIRKT